MISLIWLSTVNVFAAANWNFLASSHRADFYVSSSGALNYEQADSFCRTNGGSLAQFKSHEEFYKITKEEPQAAWIQATRNGDIFEYDDGARVGEFGEWLEGEPNNWGGIESRVNLHSRSFNDLCPKYELFALCEKHRSENWQLLVSSPDADFFISDEIMTNSEADFHCHRNGAILAKFYSEQEFDIVASASTQMSWIQGRRPCQDRGKFTCESGDMRNLFVYNDGTEVGVHAQWASGKPTYGNESSVALSGGKLHDYHPTLNLVALCRREWKPLVTVDRVQFFMSVSSSLHFDGAKMLCHRQGGKLAQFKAQNEYLSVIAQNNRNLWIDGKTVGEYASWRSGQPGEQDRVSLWHTGELNAMSPDHPFGALCERENLNALNHVAETGDALLFSSVGGNFTFDEGSSFCRQLGGEVAWFKSAEEFQMLSEKLLHGRYWIAGSRRGDEFYFPDEQRVEGVVEWWPGEPNNWQDNEDRVELINGKLNDRQGTDAISKVLCRRSTISISSEELQNNSTEELLKEKLDCAGRWGSIPEKKAFCEYLVRLLTRNTLEDQISFSLLNTLGFSNFKIIEELSDTCISRRRSVDERRSVTAGALFRRAVPSGTGRYDIGELEGNAREMCREWVSKVDAQNGDNLCADIANANQISLEALELTESANTDLALSKSNAALQKVRVSAGYFAAAAASSFSLSFGDAGGYVVDGALMLMDSLETAADAHYQFKAAAVNRMEQSAQKLNAKVAKYDECSRPSTTELNCGIGQLSIKLDKYLPLMNYQLDSLILSSTIIEGVAIDIKNDMRTVLSDLSELENMYGRLINYVEHDSEVLQAIQRLDEVHRSSLEAESTDFARWFAIYNEDSSCSTLIELDTFAMRILNYLARSIDDERGNLLTSCRPINNLERPSVEDYLAPYEVELWMKEYTSEFHYLMKLARFGYSMNMLLHLKGYQELNISLETYFDNIYPKVDYREANSRHLEGLDFIDSYPKLQICKSCGTRGENIFSYCKEDEMSQTYCTNCHKHYHYHSQSQDCIKNTCTCDNGQAKEWCERNDDTQCDGCDPGYHAEGSRCRKARCTCNNGAPVSEMSCPLEGQQRCGSCNTHYRLSNYRCTWRYTCTCSGGVPKVGPNQCYGGENCQYCNSGYRAVGSSCKPNCVCSNGTPVDANHCPQLYANKCKSCNSNYKLVNGQCQWKHTCTCLNGTPKGQGNCWGGENCNSCRSGYVLLGNLCTEQVSGNVIRSGDKIALKANCGSSNQWLSNYCTVNCGQRSEVQPCPGSRFYSNEENTCTGERLWIMAEGKAIGEAIRFGDVVGLYYGANHWFSCEGKGKQCQTRPCPGSRTQGKSDRGWSWNNHCSWEKFQIQSSLWRRSTRHVMEWHDVSIVRLGTHDGWVSRDGNKVTLRSCPGNDGQGWLTHNCDCERWNIDKI